MPGLVRSQLATGIFFGSQHMRQSPTIKQNAFSISTELSYQSTRWWGRIFYRSILPKNTVVNAQYEVPSSSSYYYYDRYSTNMKVTYRENIIGASIALTAAKTYSKTRPYVMFECGMSSINLNIAAGDSINKIYIGGDIFTPGLNKDKGLHMRLTSGIQFKIKPDLCLTTEASIAGGAANSIYDHTIWAVDIGLRWFFMDRYSNKKKK